MPRKVSTSGRKIVYLLALLGTIVRKRTLHKLVYTLQERGAGFKYDFVSEGNFKFSSKLDKELEELISLGYVKRLYVLNGKFNGLYSEAYSITEKGVKLAERAEFGEKSRKLIEDLVKEIKSKKKSPSTQLSP
ncbi:MAG: hypothetical protein B6U69_00090 [Thermofilum sp. ex4484_15]|nr:MAG: hypothetical protein B6U69_00090 [Thermofilum sp. ex4484_15]